MKLPLLSLTTVTAFMQPTFLTTPTRTAAALMLPSSSILLSEGGALDQVVRVAVSDAVSDTAAGTAITDPGASSLLDQVSNGAVSILTSLAAVAFLLYGITVIFASFIIPAAAKQLEEQCKERDPALWEEYEARLEEGERMVDRPDLMQELGDKVNGMLQIEFEAEIAAKEKKERDVKDGIIDATVVTEKDENWQDH